jgi:hypothetical protein
MLLDGLHLEDAKVPPGQPSAIVRPFAVDLSTEKGASVLVFS